MQKQLSYKTILILLLFLAFICTAKATNYYVDKLSGNDGNNGLTPTTAWQTLANVNTFTFSPGDSILFKRGGIWRGQLTPKSGSNAGYVTYAAYGTGAKPLLMGSVNLSATTDWVNLGGNIWQSLQSSTVDIGNVIFNNTASFGVKKWADTSLLNQGDYSSTISATSRTPTTI